MIRKYSKLDFEFEKKEFILNVCNRLTLWLDIRVHQHEGSFYIIDIFPIMR